MTREIGRAGEPPPNRRAITRAIPRRALALSRPVRGLRPAVLLVSGARRFRADGTVTLDAATREVARWGRATALGRVSFRYLALLLIRPGLVPTEECVEAVWGDDDGGGPLNASGCLSVHASRLRSVLAALGIVPVSFSWAHEAVVLPAPVKAAA